MSFIVFRQFLPNQCKVNCVLKFKADSTSTYVWILRYCCRGHWNHIFKLKFDTMIKIHTRGTNNSWEIQSIMISPWEKKIIKKKSENSQRIFAWILGWKIIKKESIFCTTRWAYSISFDPASVCPPFSKIFFSEITWPINCKFYVEHHWEGGPKFI